MTTQDVKNLVSEDKWMMEVLRVARSVALPDWMIGAGFIRNKVWDHLHGLLTPQEGSDIDLIYFDPANVAEECEKNVEQKLRNILDDAWSVKNMARMHLVNNDQPYSSTTDGLAHWVETATCVAVKLDDKGEVVLIAPHGIGDLVNLVLRPAPHINRIEDFQSRVDRKQWLKKWPKLNVILEKQKPA